MIQGLTLGKLCLFIINKLVLGKLSWEPAFLQLLALPLDVQRGCFRGNLAYRMKMELSSVLYLLGLLTGGSSGFFQLDTCEILAVGSAGQMFGLLAVCSEGRIASSLRCSARHLFAQNSSLVES